MRAIGFAGCLMLAACGQTGALYLPDEGVETPVEIRGPETPAPETAPDPEEDEEQKPGQPPADR